VQAHGGLILLDASGTAVDDVAVVRAVGAEFVGSDDGKALVRRDGLSLLDCKLGDASRDLGTDDHVVGRHDAGQGKHRLSGPQRVVHAGGHDEGEDEADSNGSTSHEGAFSRGRQRAPPAGTARVFKQTN